MSNQGPLDFKPPSVNGVEDPDLDPDGYIPLDLLLAGMAASGSKCNSQLIMLSRLVASSCR